MSRQALALLALCAALLTGCSDSGKTEAVQSPSKGKPANIVYLTPEAQRAIAVEEVQLRAMAGELTLPGKVQYSEDRFAKISSPVVGRVTDVRAKLGERVAAGQVLLTIESADIGSAYSDYVKAESDLQFSTRNYEVAKELYETKALSKKDLVQAQNDFLKLQAEYRRARQRLLALKVPAAELDKPRAEQRISSRFDLKAPIGGTLIERNVTVGQMVGNDPAQMLYTIADLTVLQVVAEVYEKDLSRVVKGMTVSVTVEAYPEEVFPATVVYIGDMVDPATRTIKVRCNVTNPNLKLKPEMFARVLLKLGAGAPVLAVPKEAVLGLGGQSYVYVQTPDGGYERRPIRTGTVASETVQVTEGLQAGERVVVRGALLLKGEQEKG